MKNFNITIEHVHICKEPKKSISSAAFWLLTEKPRQTDSRWIVSDDYWTKEFFIIVSGQKTPI
jgi:hypothetical protein